MTLKASEFKPHGDNTDFYRRAIQEPSVPWFNTFSDTFIDDRAVEPFGVSLGKFVAVNDREPEDNIVLFAPLFISWGGGVLAHPDIATRRVIEGDPASLDTRIPAALHRAAANGLTLLGPVGQQGVMTDGGMFEIKDRALVLIGYSGNYGPGDPEAREMTVNALQTLLPDVDVTVE